MTQGTGTVTDVAVLRALLEDVESLPRAELLAVQQRAVAVRREADVLLARVAAEVARRSQPDDGSVGLARREGHQSAQGLVASAAGGSQAEAARLMRVGQVLARDAEATRASTNDTAGSAEPSASGARGRDDGPRFPALAAALRAGRLSVDAGACLADALERVAEVLSDVDLAKWETEVVTKAIGLPLMKVRRLVSFAEARVRPKDLEAREEQQYARRSVTLRPEADGMITLTAHLDPVSAAPVRSMLDAYVRDAFQKRRDALKDTESHSPAADGQNAALAASMRAAGSPEPTAMQLRADALVWLARHAQGCESDHAGVKTTVVVRVDLDALRAGVGTAEIDGAQGPISVTALRQMAADAEVIPAVLGSDGEILDWGRKRRFFTHAQRLALVERDGGCARCHAPPSWCEGHHIEWWERDKGRSDLSNGVLLCVRCHHDIHRDGWDITVKNNRVYFTPPRAPDRTRTPALGGRARVEATVSV